MQTDGAIQLNPLGTQVSYHMWATSGENLFMPYVNNKGADQPAHPRSLISAFVASLFG